MASARHHSLETGLLLVAIGLLFLLDNLGIADMGEVISTWWPLLLVGLGIWMIAESRRTSSAESRRWTFSAPSQMVVVDGEEVVETRLFGDLNLQIKSPSFKKGSVHATFGSVAVDLEGLQPADASARLALNTLFGEVRLRIPPDLPVHLIARANFGSVRVGEQERSGFNSVFIHRSPSFDTSDRRLTVVANSVFGDVLVDLQETAG